MRRNNLFITIAILFCIGLLIIASDFAQKSEGSGEPVPTEEPIVLSAASVNLTEQDYAEMEQVKVDIRERLIEHPDPELYSEIEGRLHLHRDPEMPSMCPDKFYVSCIPFLSWSYEKGTLSYGDTLGIWAFDDKKRESLESNNVVLLTLNRDEKGKLHVEGSYTQCLDSMQKNPDIGYILIRIEKTYGHCFLREDGKVYDQTCSGPEYVQVQGELCKRFDWDRMSVCYEEIVKPENLAAFKFK